MEVCFTAGYGFLYPVSRYKMEIDKNFVPTTIYRHTTVGKTLIESLDILESSEKISKALKEETLQKFDVEILSTIRNGVKILTFEKAKLRNFR